LLLYISPLSRDSEEILFGKEKEECRLLEVWVGIRLMVMGYEGK